MINKELEQSILQGLLENLIEGYFDTLSEDNIREVFEKALLETTLSNYPKVH